MKNKRKFCNIDKNFIPLHAKIISTMFNSNKKLWTTHY